MVCLASLPELQPQGLTAIHVTGGQVPGVSIE